MLIAAVIGLGMNHGLGRLARSTQFSYRQLAWAADWHIREDTLRGALIDLDQFVLHHPPARSWGDGTRSASDGMRARVGVNAANADRNAAYFGPGRGVTIYGHTADFRLAQLERTTDAARASQSTAGAATQCRHGAIRVARVSVASR